MGRRRRDDGIEGLIGLIAVILFLFGTVIIAFLKRIAKGGAVPIP